MRVQSEWSHEAAWAHAFAHVMYDKCAVNGCGGAVSLIDGRWNTSQILARMLWQLWPSPSLHNMPQRCGHDY